MITAGPGRTRLLASGLLAVTFAVGALVGAAGERLIAAREPSREQEQTARTAEERNRGRGASARGGSIFLEPGVFDQIGATPAQRKTIQDILAHREQGAKSIWREFEPRMEAMMDSTRGEIRAQLTQEQQTKLDQIIRERRARMKEQRGHRDGDTKSKADSTKKKTENQP
jgi:hypothetical protein